MKFAFLLFLLLPIAGQTYVAWRTWQLLPDIMPLRMAVVGLMALAFVTFFVAMSGVIDRWPMSLATLTYEAGTSWLMILLYLFLVFVCLDVLRLCHVVSSAALHSNGWLSGGIAVALTVLFTLAYFHYNDKKRVKMVVTTKKNMKMTMKKIMMMNLTKKVMQKTNMN